MSIEKTEAEMVKHLTAIAKLGKAELGDAKKAKFVKDAQEILTQQKTFDKRRTELNKRIKDAKSLKDDIKSYIDDHTKLINKSMAVSRTTSGFADTKDRDYFWVAQYLTMIGQDTLDDYP